MALVRGRITDDRGQPVPGTRIDIVTRGGSRVRRRVTGDDGTYGFRITKAGRYEWRAEAVGHWAASGGFAIDVRGRVSGAPVIVLSRLGSIAGAVLDEQGRGLDHVVVRARDAAGLPLSPVTSGADGRYRLANLLSGEYGVEAEPPPDRLPAPPRRIKVALGEESSGVDFVLLPAGVATGPAVPTGLAVPTGPGLPTGPALPGGVTGSSEDGRPSTQPGRVPTLPAASGPPACDDEVAAFLRLLNGPEFSIEQPISESDAEEAITLFSLAGLLIAGLGHVRIGDVWTPDVLGVLALYYGIQDKSLQRRLFVSSPALWRNIEGDMRELRDALDTLGADIGFLQREARRQFNLGRNNEVLGNVRFTRLFERYVDIVSDPLLTLDVRAEDGNPASDKEKLARALDLLFDLKGVIIQLVASLSRYGTIATRRANLNWATVATRALRVLDRVGRAQLTEDLDDQNAFAVLSVITRRSRDRDILPFVVLARNGGRMLRLAMDVYRATRDALDDYGREQVIELFQPAGDPTRFRTVAMRAEAAQLRRYPLASWQ